MILPAGVRRELDQLTMRTGYTKALDKAEQRLPEMFKLTPEGFESFTRMMYQRMDSAALPADDTEIIELEENTL